MNLWELSRLRELAATIPSHARAKKKSRRAGDRTGNAAVRIVELERLIIERNERLMELRREIGEKIEAVEDMDLCLILQKRYLAFQGFERIAADMNYTYRHTTRLHGRALAAFQGVLDGGVKKDVL